MKNFLLAIILIFCSTGIFAQQNYFVYLQSENKQPFYIKMDKQVLSSSSNGYLIIPKLSDGEYNLQLVFPRTEIPEQQLVCRVDKKDAGYLIKNLGEAGWGLANLQSQEVIAGAKIVPVSSGPQKEIMDDPFSNMLAKVVNDPSIKEKDETDVSVKVQDDKVQEGKEADKVQEVKEADKVQEGKEADKLQEGKEADKAQGLKPQEGKPVELSIVKRTYRKKTKDGLDMTYIVVDGEMRDTVKILLPIEKVEVKKPVEVVKDNKKSEAVKKEEAPVKADEVKTPVEKPVEKPIETKPVVTTGMINSDCKNFAVADDVTKLKKKITVETDIDEMVRVARKVFKSKCFTTEQIRDIGTLFLTNEGRYQFFDAAYPWVSDTDNFSSLQSQLTEDYYINRFKAMIHK